MLERCKTIWKSKRAWLYANAAVFLTWSQIDPLTALMVFTYMPPVVQEFFPINIFAAIGVGLFVWALIRTFMKRKKPDACDS